MVSGEMRVARGAGEPGWLIVVGDRSLVALPAGAPGTAAASAARATADALADPTAQPEELEALIARIPLGADGLDAFALVWWPPGAGRLTAVVRGAASVELTTFDGSRRLDSLGIHPWHLAEFRDVVAIRIGAAGAGAGGMTSVDVSESVISRILRVSGLEWRAPGHGFDADPGDDPRRERGDGMTDDPGDDTHEDAAGSAREAAHFRMPGGESREVAGVVLIGRRPAPPRIEREAVDLVRVAATASAVSATHLELRREGSRLVATDLRSTNGTVVRTATGSRRMRAGESIVVAPGAVLELGGDTIVEILPPPKDQAHPDRQVPA